jgi:16S rRNA (uracil1498-N3)-methyltransferase
MARRRFFVERVHHGQAEVEGDQAHHLRNVLRVEAGQRYEISDNERVYLAEVSLSTKRRVVFDVQEELPAILPPARVCMYLALIKFDRFELAVEKATELGAVRIVPVVASRSEKGLEKAVGKRVERWRKIAHEASQQSRRVRQPEVADAVSFAAAVQDESRHRFFLEEQDGVPILPAVLPQEVDGGEVAVLVGPEGGWSAVERDLVEKGGWQAVSLGPQILRTETAAIASIAIVMAHWAKQTVE